MTQRTFILHTPLDPDQLKLRGMSGIEGLSCVSDFLLDLHSPPTNIDANALLGDEGVTQSDGHFYFRPDAPEGRERRARLAAYLYEQGPR